MLLQPMHTKFHYPYKLKVLIAVGKFIPYFTGSYEKLYFAISVARIYVKIGVDICLVRNTICSYSQASHPMVMWAVSVVYSGEFST